MNHIFGPVNSRRLGRSLGVDLFQEKICNLNCIYCEVGETTRVTCERAEYVPTAEIIEDIDKYCRVVDMKELEENEFNLNIKRYIDSSEEEEIIDVKQVNTELEMLEKEKVSIDKRVKNYLKELKY